MSRTTLLRGCGQIVSGSLDTGLLDADSIRVEGHQIVEIGVGLSDAQADLVIDVAGAIVLPGLIDSHAHPVIGDFTPRQNAAGWTQRVVHGGVTSLISAGETHWPGRSRDGQEAKAICAASFLTSRLRSAEAARVFGGALLLDQGITTADIDELHDLGVRLLGEIGLGSEKEPTKIAELVEHARSLGWAAPLHFGGASVPGSSVIDADLASIIRPSIISHANGGPTARPMAEVIRLIETTDAAIEIVFAGNMKTASLIIDVLIERGEIHRLQLGTDTPSGTGVVPLAMLRLITEMVGRSRLDPVTALCAATGITAKRYNLNGLGHLLPGATADIVVLDSPLGSDTADAFAAMRMGNVPSVAAVLMEGELVLTRSSVTPPPDTPVTVYEP